MATTAGLLGTLSTAELRFRIQSRPTHTGRKPASARKERDTRHSEMSLLSHPGAPRWSRVPPAFRWGPARWAGLRAVAWATILPGGWLPSRDGATTVLAQLGSFGAFAGKRHPGAWPARRGVPGGGGLQHPAAPKPRAPAPRAGEDRRRPRAARAPPPPPAAPTGAGQSEPALGHVAAEPEVALPRPARLHGDAVAGGAGCTARARGSPLSRVRVSALLAASGRPEARGCPSLTTTPRWASRPLRRY